MTSTPSSWLRPRQPSPASLMRLFCCAHAGGGAAAFNSWARFLGVCEVIKVQLPGREDNWERPPARTVSELLPGLLLHLASLLDRPFAFYGHSMGAIVMFELTRELRRRGFGLPLVLFVSGRRAPQLPLSHVPLFSLSDDALLEQVRGMGAASLEMFGKARWRERFFPTLRADLEVSDRYSYRAELPLACPIHAFGGADDSTVKPHEWQAWGQQTSAGYVGRMLSGRHFFDKEGQSTLLRHIGDALSRLAPPIPGGVIHETV